MLCELANEAGTRFWSCCFGSATARVDVVSDVDFGEFKIDAFQWKRRVVDLLISADREISGETLYDWGCRIRDYIEIEIKLGLGRSWSIFQKHPAGPRCHKA